MCTSATHGADTWSGADVVTSTVVRVTDGPYTVRRVATSRAKAGGATEPL
jgi:hypothetical protein